MSLCLLLSSHPHRRDIWQHLLWLEFYFCKMLWGLVLQGLILRGLILQNLMFQGLAWAILIVTVNHLSDLTKGAKL